ncbi:MAG: TonB family protein, partial [Thermoanaerobaculia bacterium]|nr:TonB family protein [Thermoanaerobaculia bacterium]
MIPKNPTASPSDRQAAVATSTLEGLSLELNEDDKVLKRMFLAAGFAHLVLFAWQLPKVEAIEVAPPERHVVTVVQTPRFVEPQPPPTLPPVEHIVRKVQIPDPTPNDPEPLREWTEVEDPVLALSPSDIPWDLPAAPPEVESSVPIPVGGDVIAPMKLHAPPPLYPEPARRARLQGVAIVEAIVDTEGSVTAVRVLKSPGMRMGEAAAEAIREWTFEPARLNGKAVAVYYT